MKKTLLIATTILFSVISQAATIIVTNTNDAGTGSLRNAIAGSINGDTIRFNPSLISTGSATISLSTEIAFSSKSLTIVGLYNNMDTLYISGNNTSRIFSINNTSKVTLDSLVLINGNGAGALSSGLGGAVLFRASDSLLVINSSIIGNSATFGGGIANRIITSTTSIIINNSLFTRNTANSGGGLYTEALSSPTSNISINNSIFSNNSVVGLGGGLLAYGIFGNYFSTITVNNSLFSGNSANLGGGIGVRITGTNSTSTITINNSTFDRDTANTSGGGINSVTNSSAASFVNVTNSTFNKNLANGSGLSDGGGGIWVRYASVNITNSTLNENIAISQGGGVRNLNSSSTVTVGSSIMNTSSIYLASPTFTSQGYNIFSDAPMGAISSDQKNVTPTQLNLGNLANNGGSTQTLMPNMLSFAFNMGTPTDTSDAQNSPIVDGRREVGAAENCATSSSESVIIAGSYTWTNGDNNTYTSDTTVMDIATATNSNGCDSILILYLTILPIADQAITATDSTICYGDSTTISTASSDTGVSYYLRNNANDSIIGGPIVGTGSAINFNTGSLTSSISYNVNATIYGPKKMDALEFSGNSGLKKVDLGTALWDSAFVGNNQLTIEVWVNRSATGSLHTVIGNYQGNYPLLFRIDGDKIAVFLNTTSVGTSTSSIPVGTWTHLAASYDGTNVRIYVNGALEVTTPHSTSFTTTTTNMSIGGGLSNNTEYFPGLIADVRFWNIARTQAEINTFKDTVLSGNETGLVANYLFTEGTGTSTMNSALGNLYPGTLINNPTWTNGPTLTDLYPFEMTQTISLTVLSKLTGSISQTICAGDSLVVNGTTYKTTVTGATEVFTNIGANSCDSTVTINLTVLPVIDTSTTINGFDITVGQTGATYQWIDCNNGNIPIAGETSATYTATANGDYAVIVTLAACSETSACVNISTVGIVINDFDNKLLIYPNPTDGNFLIDLGKKHQSVTITITDLGGKLIQSQNYSQNQLLNINLEAPAGVYLLIIESGDKKASIRLVKK